MTSSEVQRLWNDAVVSYEAATGTKLNSLPSIANASDILNALQTQGTRFEAFRHSKSKVDKIRSTLGETLYFVDQLSKMLTPALSSVSFAGMIKFCDVNASDIADLCTSPGNFRRCWDPHTGNQNNEDKMSSYAQANIVDRE